MSWLLETREGTRGADAGFAIAVDQPVGTGYSYANTNSYVHELPVVRLAPFELELELTELWRRWHLMSSSSCTSSTRSSPSSQRTTCVSLLASPAAPLTCLSQTYLAGESYAGQYIPYIAKAILETTRISTPLKGLLIGNGWIDPINQYPAYLDFALDAGVVKKGSATETSIRKSVDSCLARLTAGGVINVKIHNGGCEGILGAITDSTVQRCVSISPGRATWELMRVVVTA